MFLNTEALFGFPILAVFSPKAHLVEILLRSGQSETKKETFWKIFSLNSYCLLSQWVIENNYISQTCSTSKWLSFFFSPCFFLSLWKSVPSKEGKRPWCWKAVCHESTEESNNSSKSQNNWAHKDRTTSVGAH